MWMRNQRMCLSIGVVLGAAALTAGAGDTSDILTASATDTAGIANAATQEPDIARFLRVRTPSGAQLAPDGTVYLRDWPDGIFQLYKRDAGESAGATGTKMTDFKDGISSYSISPDGSRILIEAGAGGSEQDDIFVLNPTTGDIVELRGDPGVVFGVQSWARDGNSFIYTANDDSPSDFHLYRYDFTTGVHTPILRREGYWYAGDHSEDGTRVLVGRYYSASSAEVYELDTTTGELTDLSVRDADGTPYYNAPVGYLGGREVLTVSDQEDGVRMMYRVDRRSGQRRHALGQDLQGYDVSANRTNAERTHLAITLNRDGFGEMHLLEMPSLRPLPLPEIEPGVVSIVDFAGPHLVYSVSNARQAGVTYRWDVRLGGEPVAITQTNDEGLDFSQFTLPELVRYESFDGLQIPAFLYMPPGVEPGQTVPFVVNYHGGPEGQHRPSFSAVTQYYLAAGYGVMLPNVRGSTGFGREFHELDNYTKRWDSVRDGVAAAKFLVEGGYAQPGRIAAVGGSYGGFMAVAVPIEDQRQVEATGREPYFGALIKVVGIVNFKTFLEQTKDYRRELREVEYGPLSDPEFLASVSPIHFIDDIKVPVMIAHGLNDPRVPVGEAMQLAVGLQKRGMDPETVYFPDEGHGFRKLDNRLLYYQRVVKFLDESIGSGHAN